MFKHIKIQYLLPFTIFIYNLINARNEMSLLPLGPVSPAIPGDPRNNKKQDSDSDSEERN